MAAPTIPPIRLGLTGTRSAVEKPHRLASRRDAALSSVPIPHVPGVAGRLVPLGDRFTGTPWRHRPRYRGGAHHIVPLRLLCGGSEAPSDLAFNLVFTGGAIGDQTTSHPEIPVLPEPDDVRLYRTEGALGGSSSKRRVTRSSSGATAYPTVFRGVDNGYRAEPVDFADAARFGVRPVGSVARSAANVMVVRRALGSAERAAVLALDPMPGAGPEPLWRPRGSTGLVDGRPGQRISSSASFAA
jgi:hypothetical protein